jgi:hypothetical protein
LLPLSSLPTPKAAMPGDDATTTIIFRGRRRPTDDRVNID